MEQGQVEGDEDSDGFGFNRISVSVYGTIDVYGYRPQTEKSRSGG